MRGQQDRIAGILQGRRDFMNRMGYWGIGVATPRRAAVVQADAEERSRRDQRQELLHARRFFGDFIGAEDVADDLPGRAIGLLCRVTRGTLGILVSNDSHSVLIDDYS